MQGEVRRARPIHPQIPPHPAYDQPSPPPLDTEGSQIRLYHVHVPDQCANVGGSCASCNGAAPDGTSSSQAILRWCSRSDAGRPAAAE